MITTIQTYPLPAATAATAPRSTGRLALRRASLVALLLLGFLLVAQAAGAGEAAPSGDAAALASGGWEGEGCGPFSLRQTYDRWGPARHYGEPVTVVYQATRCSVDRGGTVHLTIEGVARIYRGTRAYGVPLDQRSFFAAGEWTGASNADGWPPDWWRCEVKDASYTWRISGVYAFGVAARDGHWDVQVSAGGSTEVWSYDAC